MRCGPLSNLARLALGQLREREFLPLCQLGWEMGPRMAQTEDTRQLESGIQLSTSGDPKSESVAYLNKGVAVVKRPP